MIKGGRKNIYRGGQLVKEEKGRKKGYLFLEIKASNLNN